MAVRADNRPVPQTPGQAASGDRYGALAAQAQADAANAGTTGAPPPAYNSDTRPVVVGKVPNVSRVTASQVPSPHPGTPDTMGDRGYDDRNYSANVTSVFDAKEMLAYWRSLRPQGDKFYDNLVGLMRATGYLGERANSLTGIEDAWTEVLKDGASLFESNTTTPGQADVIDYLYGLLQSNGDQTQGDGPSGGGGGTGITTTVDLTDPGSAMALADSALTQYLGRRASDKEQEQFRKALRAMEMANPQTANVETVRTKDGKKVNTTSAVVRGGDFNPQVFADEWAQGKEGAGEYQAATTFLDAFIGSLGNPTEVVR
jgi:hypothetical protein